MKNLERKKKIINFFTITLSSELICKAFGGKNVINSEKYLKRAFKLDARRKGFKENVRKLMLEYDNHHANSLMKQGIITKEQKKQLSDEQIFSIIILKISEYLELSIKDIKKKSRKKEINEARWICWFFLKRYTDMSLTAMGLDLGGKRHATVLHGLKCVKKALDGIRAGDKIVEYDKGMKLTINELEIYFKNEFKK